MKIVLQRVLEATVRVDDEIVGQIDRGVLLLVGFGRDNPQPELARAVDKIVNLRIFSNDAGKLDRSLLDVGGSILAVPQFTLYGQTRKGRRPDFTAALEPAPAEFMFQSFVTLFKQTPVLKVETGQFSANMKVSLTNDGPFTLTLKY